MKNLNVNQDWSESTVKMRPLLNRLEEALHREDVKKAEALAREIKAYAEGVIGYCMHNGR